MKEKKQNQKQKTTKKTHKTNNNNKEIPASFFSVLPVSYVFRDALPGGQLPAGLRARGWEGTGQGWGGPEEKGVALTGVEVQALSRVFIVPQLAIGAEAFHGQIQPLVLPVSQFPLFICPDQGFY